MKKKICGAVFAAAMLLLIGTVGGLEQSLITEAQCFWRSMILLTVMYISGKLGAWSTDKRKGQDNG